MYCSRARTQCAKSWILECNCSYTLDGLPLSEVLHCAIELWENLQLDDDELLEIAIREISSQIQTQKAKDDVDCFDNESDKNWPEESRRIQNMHQEYVRKGVY